MTRGQFISHAESCQKPLRRFLTALCCGDSQLADDIAQDSLLKAYLASDGFDNPDKFNAWIYRIAYNTFINSRRAPMKTSGYDEVAEVAGPESSDSAFRYQALYDALGRLPDKERTVILLFYMQGYTTREIAGITGSSEDAVRQRLSRGRNHLRDFMDRLDAQ